MIMEDWIWLGVLIAFLVGLFCWALWYAKRQKALRDQPVTGSTADNSAVSPSFVPGEPYDDLPHVWTFAATGIRVYTNMLIATRNSEEVQFTNGGKVNKRGVPSGLHVRKGQGFVVKGGMNDPFIRLGSTTFLDSQLDIK